MCVAFMVVLATTGIIWKAFIVSIFINEMLDFVNKYANNIVSGLDIYHEPKKEDKSILFMQIKLPKIIKGRFRLYWGILSTIIIILTLL